MKRRKFLESLGRMTGLAAGVDLLGLGATLGATAGPLDRLTASLLVPMDDAQSDHLKAYGVTYRVIQAGGKVEWLLNYRGGSFLLPDAPTVRRDAALNGVAVEPVDDGQVTGMRGEIAGTNADSVPLEKAPKVAVYVPPNTQPWDDAVTMALQYAGISVREAVGPPGARRRAARLRLAAPAP